MSQYSAPAPAGRDLRMTLEVRAQADGDEWLSRLITKAVEALSEGAMYPGKSHTEYSAEGGYAEVTMVGYRQTWDGDETPP